MNQRLGASDTRALDAIKIAFCAAAIAALYAAAAWMGAGA